MLTIYRKVCLHPVTTIANTTKILVAVLLGSWLIAALLFTLTEGAGVLDSLYWSMTTMTTVGYGDFSPATTAGKWVTMFFQAWSIFFLVPCVVANIVDKVRRDDDKFTHDEQEWQENALKAIAERVGVSLPDAPADTNYDCEN